VRTYRVQALEGYEPYVIVSRDLFVPYDERFRGYGKNKIVQLRWMASRGAQWHVLPGHFVLEEYHKITPTYNFIKSSPKRLQRMQDLYDSCVADMKKGKSPRVSHTTVQLFREYGIH
jgi:hypothetical protein